ncbi:sucrase ferredoxin [Marisediminicola sp. LYQ85]|uniref:sucrase ferredoxin n=1 Tax=Marisediminicola sp. LYQ85 TaxID=3391062 RepID=UPI0039838962
MTEPSDTGWMPCSDRSLERRDPLEGTAGYGERWFLVEIDGAWGHHAILQSRLPPEIASTLVRRVERAGMRPLAIRRTGRRADERRAQREWSWAVVDCRPGRESIMRGSVTDPALLLEVPLDGSTGTPSDEPIVAVCTHARHDQCCAVRGRPVVTTLAHNHPEITWECSHLGGDRFAATLVVFPHGLFFGRVPAAEAPAVIAGVREGVIDLRYFRGRSSSPNAVQAAEAFVRERSGDTAIDAFGDATATRDDSGSWTVALDHRGETRTVRLAEQMSAPLLSTCSATRAAPVREFELESIDPPPAAVAPAGR